MHILPISNHRVLDLEVGHKKKGITNINTHHFSPSYYNSSLMIFTYLQSFRDEKFFWDIDLIISKLLR
jgi:hypothetical protein